MATTRSSKKNQSAGNKVRKKKTGSRGATRPLIYKKKPAGLDTFTCNMALDHIATRIMIARANNTNNAGVAPHRAITNIVEEMKPTLPWLNKEMVKNHLKKLKKSTGMVSPAYNKSAGSGLLAESGASQSSSFSSLTKRSPATGSRGATTSTSISTIASSTPDRHGHAATTVTTGSISGVVQEDEEGAQDGDVLPEAAIVVGGRPKGVTSSYKRNVDNRVRLAIAEATRVYNESIERIRNKGESVQNDNAAGNRLAPGELKSIIATAKSKYNVATISISESTIRSRFKRRNLDPKISQGTLSPMAHIEPYIVEVIKQLSRMRVPINATTGLHLINSMIEGTTIAKELQEWKLKHVAHVRLNTPSTSSAAAAGTVRRVEVLGDINHQQQESIAANDNTVILAAASTTQKKKKKKKKKELILGNGYWRGFMRRNKHDVRLKKPVKFESKRAEWCTYENFSTMYDEVYREMADGGIASKVDRKIYLDKKGQIVEHKEDSYGLPTQYLMLLVFVDEVGSNTSTTKDGNVGGERFLCEAMARPQIKAAMKDSHFTVLGFTAGTGEPVMCAIIFAAKEICESWVLGFNGAAPWVGEEEDMRSNTGGLDKRYPQGPTCFFNGKTVPTLCCCSENGSITADLLVGMLSTMDKLNLFDRSDGIPPFLLLDGHGSRFDIKFVRYVNTEHTRWTVCIGLPYGTSYWQVGDSSEQNGCFKMALTRYKRELLGRRESVHEEFAIHKDDIAYLVHQAWMDSFARVPQNKKAIAERGWGPLNYRCLLDPEIVATQHKEQSNIELAEQLNLSNGLAGSLIDTILDSRLRQDARNGVDREERKRKQIEKAKEIIAAKKKRYSAGLHVLSNQFRIGPNVLKELEERLQNNQDKISQSEEKKLQLFRILRCKVAAIQSLGRTKEQLNVAQLRTLVNWYKCDGDTAVRNIKHLLLERLAATECRGDPVEPPLPSAHSSSLQQEQVAAPTTIGAQAADVPSGEEDDSVLAASGSLAVPLIC